MTSRRLFLLAAAVGLAAGIAAGLSSSHKDETAPRAGASASPHTAGALPLTVQADPMARLAFPSDDARIARVFSALREPVRLRQRWELFEALRDLTAAELPALVKHAESLPKEMASELLPALVERWFELDPRAAQAWALSSPMEWRTIQAWARADPEGALRAAASSKEWWAFSLVPAALDALHGGDADAKAAWARSLPPGALRESAMAAVLHQRAKADPAAAFAAIAELPAGRAREEARETVLRAWAERDPAGALAKLGEILPELKAGVLGNDLVKDIAERVAAKNPRLVLDWLGAIPEELRSAPAIATAAKWAEKEPLAALEWCMASGVDVARPRWHSFGGWQAGVLGEAMASAPAAAVAWLEALAPGAERERLMESALRDSLWRTPKDQLFGAGDGVAWRLFRQLPEEGQIAMAGRLGEVRAQQGDFSSLGAFAQELPPGLARANAVAGAMGAAFQHDASRVEALLAGTAAGPDRDAALRGLARAMSHNAPADAAARALGIGDATVRQEALEAVVLPWLESDAGASRAWLRDTAAVPAAWKQEWLRRHESARAKALDR